MVTPDIGLFILIGGMVAAFISGFVGAITLIVGKPGYGPAAKVFFACIILCPASLLVSFIGFILMCYGFVVQILPAAS